MSIYDCIVCGSIYNEEKEVSDFNSLPPSWKCPVCESGKSYFKCIDEDDSASKTPLPQDSDSGNEYLQEWRRVSDDLEIYMSDIHQMAELGESITEPMRTKSETPLWNQILILGAQLSSIPLNKTVSVNTQTVIGSKSQNPLTIETPIFVTHMSFGALSREAKIALAKGSAAVKTAMCSGEGGILPESLENSYRYIFEYVPNKYSVNLENLKKVDAVEIKIGQSAKPGMGGHLPANKATKEIAHLRGFPEGADIISPAAFDEIRNAEDLKKTVMDLKEKTGGKPIGIKLAAGHIEADIDIALEAEIDFITIDGRPGATGASPKFIKLAASIPTIYALHRARKHLDKRGAKGVSLIITGGLRISSDFAKALALGADAIAIGTSALIACGCQQYRSCNTGKCPVGITTQDPQLRKRFNIDISAKRLENFLTASTEELKDFARLTGKNNVHNLNVKDLCAFSKEIAEFTGIHHAGSAL